MAQDHSEAIALAEENLRLKKLYENLQAKAEREGTLNDPGVQQMLSSYATGGAAARDRLETLGYSSWSRKLEDSNADEAEVWLTAKKATVSSGGQVSTGGASGGWTPTTGTGSTGTSPGFVETAGNVWGNALGALDDLSSGVREAVAGGRQVTQATVPLMVKWVPIAALVAVVMWALDFDLGIKREWDSPMKAKAILGVIGAAAAGWLGGFDKALIVLLSVMLTDYLTGLLCAICGKSKHGPGLSSNIMLMGGAKKVGGLVLVGVAFAFDSYIGQAVARTPTVGFLIAVEILSVIENLALIGVPIPAFLLRVLEVAKQQYGEEGKPGAVDGASEGSG